MAMETEIDTKKHNIQLNDIVYHEDVYNFREQLRVVGITADKLTVEGDFSGGTNGFLSTGEIPVAGTSKVFNYGNLAALYVKARDLSRTKEDMDVVKFANECMHAVEGIIGYRGIQKL